MVRMASYEVSLGVDQADIKKKILNAYIENGLTPPCFKELKKSFDIETSLAKDVLMLLMDEGMIAKAKRIFILMHRLSKICRKNWLIFLNHGEISTPQFKEMTWVSRKYLIPLIEYFDAQNVTIRIGDIRKLRNR